MVLNDTFLFIEATTLEEKLILLLIIKPTANKLAKKKKKFLNIRPVLLTSLFNEYIKQKLIQTPSNSNSNIFKLYEFLPISFCADYLNKTQ